MYGVCEWDMFKLHRSGSNIKWAGVIYQYGCGCNLFSFSKCQLKNGEKRLELEVL